MMRVLFDLNVVLDILLDRQPWSASATPHLRRVLQGELGGFVCATSVPTLFYIIRKAGGMDKAVVSVLRCLEAFEVAAVDGAVLRHATAMAGKDFEDNVQAAAAAATALDVILTRDVDDFVKSPVRALTPEQLEAELTGP